MHIGSMKLHFYHLLRSYDCPHQHGNMGPISHLILFPEYACYLQELLVNIDIYPILTLNNNFFFSKIGYIRKEVHGVLRNFKN